MSSYPRRLVLVVDTQQRFIDDARAALGDQRLLSVHDLGEAREVVLGGRVDVVVLGPAFASDVAISQARELLTADPTVQLVLVTDVVTNRLLKSALRNGFADVLDTPLHAADVTQLLTDLPAAIPVEVAPAPAVPTSPEPGTAVPDPIPDPSVAVPDQVEGPAAQRAHFTESTGFSVPESVQPATPPGEARQPPPSPLRAPTPEPAPAPAPSAPTPTPPAPEPAPAEPEPNAAPQAPQPTVPAAIAPVEPTREQPTEAPPSPPVPEPDSADTRPHVVEKHGAFAPPAPDVLDAVLPPPPSRPPPPDPDGPHQSGDGFTPPSKRVGDGTVIAVTAGKGGSGKTVVATNLAIALGLRGDPERVAIVDADLQFGDVALLLHIDPVRTIDDLVGRTDAMSDERLERALLRHESGLRVLPAPVLPIDSGEISPKQIIEVIHRLRSMYDVVVVDTGPVFDDGLVSLLDFADEVITVVDMDLPSVKNGRVALDRLRQIGFDVDEIRLVVNRVNSKARFDLVELERSLGLRVSGSIPMDRLVARSVNEGIPALASSPRSKVARAFRALAETLDTEDGRERLEVH